MYTVSTVITHEIIEEFLKTGVEFAHCRIQSGLPKDSVLSGALINIRGDLTLVFNTTESVGDAVTIEIERIIDKPQEDDIPF